MLTRSPRNVLAAATLLGALAVLAAPNAEAQTRRVFFGNLHSHTSYSDGSGTPEQAYRHARDNGRLDFLAITEHNHKSAESGAGERRDGLLIATNPALYKGPQSDALIPVADRLTTSTFVAIYGQEFSSISGGNHVNVFDVGEVIDATNGRFDLLVNWLGAHPDGNNEPPVIQFNHPALFDKDNMEYGADDFPTQADWLSNVGRFASLIELLNGPAMTKTAGNEPAERMERDYFQYLNLGFRLAPSADQDNHYLTWGTATDARTAVIAPALTRRDIIAAMRARHVYATEDENLELVFTVNGALQGDVIGTMPAVGAPLDVRFTIHDRDEPDASYEIEVYSDDGPGGTPVQLLDTFVADASVAEPNAEFSITDITFRGAGQYILFKIRQVDEDGDDDFAWTAPVWFVPGAGSGTAGTTSARITSLLPNPTGDERQDEEVTIRNTGTQSINLTGWTLRDADGRTWALTDNIAANAQRTFRRLGQPMSLNNNGDTVTLINPQGVIVHSTTYGPATQGQRITAP